MKTADRPLLGVTMGDPGGIGPEICAKALDELEIYELCRPLVVGDAGIMADAIRFCGLNLLINRVDNPRQGAYHHGMIDLLDMANFPLSRLAHKQISADQGKASFDYVAKVIALALEGEIDGTVTAPISKEALNLAGYHYAGHTEIYADMTKTRDYAMMLADGPFRVVHVSTHVSLKEACERVTRARVKRVIELTSQILKDLGIRKPRIGVAGLNPHCGEGGLFGDEDAKEIAPAVTEATEKGINVQGPISADTVFSKMRGGQFDAVVVMYHDQGHIPMKLIGFQYDDRTGAWQNVGGVNVTLGLPIIRTSVDHGTAFGKAGEGRANPQSMIEAVKLAALLARAKRDKRGSSV